MTEDTAVAAQSRQPSKYRQFKKLVEEVEKMTVLELNGAREGTRRNSGVSAQAVAVARPAAARQPTRRVSSTWSSPR